MLRQVMNSTNPKVIHTSILSTVKAVELLKNDSMQSTVKIRDHTYELAYDNRRMVTCELIRESESMVLFGTTPFDNVREINDRRSLAKVFKPLYRDSTFFIPKKEAYKFVDRAAAQLIRCVTQGACMVRSADEVGLTRGDVCDLFSNILGREIKPNYISVQKRRPFVPWSVPRIPETEALVTHLVENVPAFSDLKVDKFFCK